MKKMMYGWMIAGLLLSFQPTTGSAGTTNGTGTTSITDGSQVITRLDEIRKMDLYKLSRTEKKELKKELLALKENARPIAGGVYISAGALILILILLIILL